ncbi:MAG: SDR family oxidoreductase [Clostridiales Family XIII bacterium]|jgi:NAD(P)-dependent dehydrogenase (short-subunit alcohol dehydrogenase family)|nr:SDR family oxidoreductase [Clostridiales Family XIII bacterium]
MKFFDKFDLTGRVALITGTSLHGIGGAAAMALSEAGAKVFLVDWNKENLEKVASAIGTSDKNIGYKQCDVSEESNCKAAVEACIEKFGRLDIMVLTAGIPGKLVPGDFNVVFDTENWRKVNNINLDGIWFMIKYGHTECAKGGVGSIIMLGSSASHKVVGAGAYTATKGAIRSLTHFFGKELGRLGIRVNTIHPGLIDTEMTHEFAAGEAAAKFYAETYPIGRVGKPEEIAMGVLFLASDASSYMTGQHLVIDGGLQFN